MSQASQIVQAIYNLSAIANELETIKSMLDPASTEETKEQIAEILSKVKETNSTVTGISSDFAKGTKMSEYYNTMYSELFQTYDKCANILQNVNTILANYSTEENATANKEAVVYQINKAIELVSTAFDWLQNKTAKEESLNNLATVASQRFDKVDSKGDLVRLDIEDLKTYITSYVFSNEQASQIDLKMGTLATSDQADNILSFLEADYESQLAEI